jgi:hypothetical protein
VLEHGPVDLPEVAGQADACAVARLDDEAGRVGGVVDGAAGVDVQLADAKRGVVLEDDERRLVAVDRRVVERPFGQIDRDAVLAGDLVRAADVVVVLVGDDDGLQLLDVAADGLEPLARLSQAQHRGQSTKDEG